MGRPILGRQGGRFVEIEDASLEATFLGPGLCDLRGGEKVAVWAPLLVNVLPVVEVRVRPEQHRVVWLYSTSYETDLDDRTPWAG